MHPRQIKRCYFFLEGATSFGTAFYFYYLFFLMEKQFGFGNLENLFVSAVHGLVYVPAAWLAGRFGQRHGFRKSLAIGFSGMVAALALASALPSAPAQIMCMLVWTVSMCFIWPSLQALVTEGESPLGVPRMVGIYNLVWSGASAVAYFAGGAIVEKLGMRSLYFLPLGIHGAQLGALAWLSWKLKQFPAAALQTAPAPSGNGALSGNGKIELNPRPIARTRRFLRMAWAANPFAYVAINTVAALIPGLARTLELSPMFAGFFCSIWFFTRWFAFLALWLWPGWHYRADWFFGAFILLVASFALMLLVPSLPVVIAAEVGFGLATGLIYYSSLYYSMDAGEAKGEHGGLHEAAIGLGIFLGPAVGAASVRLFPAVPNAGALAVSGLLCGGLLLVMIVCLKRAPR